MHRDNVDGVTDTDIKDAYNRGAVITLLEPTQATLERLAAKVDHSLSVLIGDDEKYQLYAFVSTDVAVHTYVMNVQEPDPEAIPLMRLVSTDQTPTSDTSAASAGARASAVGDSETVERALDHFVEWLDNKAPKSWKSGAAMARANARASASSASISDLVKAQTVNFTDSVTTQYLLTTNVHPSTTLTNTYTIYAVYSYDQAYDYYIVDQEVQLANGNMYKGMIDELEWETDIEVPDAQIMGYYLNYHYTYQNLQTASGANFAQGLASGQADIIQSSPDTGVGTTSYTTSQSYTISGSLGFSGMGGTGSVSGGATYSSSSSVSLSDVQINNQNLQSAVGAPAGGTTTCNARWTYQVQNLPHPKNEQSIFYPHKSTIEPEPPAIARQTAKFCNSWIWMVPTAKSSSAAYQVLCRYKPTYAYCFSAADWPSSYNSVDNGTDPGYLLTHTIKLTPPPRS
jgi:hypothetical protein